MTSKKMNAWQRAAIQTKVVKGFRRRTSTQNSEEQSDWDTQEQIKYGDTSHVIWGIISEYCSNSTIHGLKYLGENKRPILERLFWVFMFGLSIYACSTLVFNIWLKWDANPVIVSFSKKATPISQIPFPTVTLCSETKVKRHFLNFTDTYKDLRDGMRANLSKEVLDVMDVITQVCDLHLTTDLEFGFENVTTNGTSIVNMLSETSFTLDDVLYECKWRKKVVPCSEMFEKVLTNEGVCYSFNSLDQRNIYRNEAVQQTGFFESNFSSYYKPGLDWDLEEGFRPDAAGETLPKRVFAVGAAGGLELLLTSNEYEHDPICRGPVSGFKNERILRFFKLYTQANCELECLTNFTLQNCGCVQFAMPRTVDTPVCGSLHIDCMERSGFEMLRQVFRQELKMKANILTETGCNCLPSCTSIIYNAEISQGNFDQKALLKSLRGRGVSKRIKENPNIQLSRFVLFFKEAQFHSSERSELYGTTEFLANCGGLLGLFMGMSALSIIELIYFCSVRLFTNLKMRRRRRNHIKSARKVSDIPKIEVINASFDD